MQNNNPKISVVCTAHNTNPPLLRRCLNSILDQTISPHEYDIILVDDYSTDHSTVDTIEEFGRKSPFIRTFRHQTKRGPNSARRTGLRMTSADFVTFVDGDDMLAKDACELLLDAAIDTGADIINGRYASFSYETRTFRRHPSGGQAMSSDYITRLSKHMSSSTRAHIWGRLFRRSSLRDYHFDLKDLILHEDFINMGRILHDTQRVANLNEVIYYYTTNQNSIMSNFTEKNLLDIRSGEREMRRIANSTGSSQQLLHAIEEGVNRRLSMCATRFITSGAMSDSEKVKMLFAMKQELKLTKDDIDGSLSRGLSFLAQTDIDVSPGQEGDFIEKATSAIFQQTSNCNSPHSAPFKDGLIVTSLGTQLCGKVVFLAREYDEFLNAIYFSRALQSTEIMCTILYYEHSVPSGTENSTICLDAKKIGVSFIPISVSHNLANCLATPKLLVVFDDRLAEFRSALELRRMLELPSLFLHSASYGWEMEDRNTNSHSGSGRASHVGLMGQVREGDIEDGKSCLIGSPFIDSLLAVAPKFPKRPLIVIDLEDAKAAEADVESWVLETCAKLGLHYQSTKGAARFADEDYNAREEASLKVGSMQKATLLICSTPKRILEALAAGKPVIIVGPVGKLAAVGTECGMPFVFASNRSELEHSLRRTLKLVKAGTDFRVIAQPFIRRYVMLSREDEYLAEQRFADFASSLISQSAAAHAQTIDLYKTRLAAAGANNAVQPESDLVRYLKTQKNAVGWRAKQIWKVCTLILKKPPRNAS